MTRTLKFVIDTNVLISRLLIPDSAPAKVVRYVLNNGYILLSEEVITEIHETLFRSKFDRYISKEARILFIEGLKTISLKIQIKQMLKYCRDPKDDKILELAVNGNANYIITGDNDLLSIREFEGISIISPQDYLKKT